MVPGLVIVALLLAAAPARIVSTYPSITETLFALGAGNRVVGVSTYCRYPAAALALPKIGTYIRPDPEKIAQLHPDLVIIDKSATAVAERLDALRIHHIGVKTGSLAEIYTMIHDVGEAIGASGQAATLNEDIRTRLDRFRAEAKSRPHPRVLIIVGRTPGLLTNLIAVGPGTYLGELLEIAGGVNALTDKTVSYPHISLETVLRLQPDIILDTSNMGENDERLREPWLARTDITKRVYGLISEALVTPGPRVPEAVELIRQKLQ